MEGSTHGRPINIDTDLARAYRELARKYEDLVGRNPAGIVVFDRDGRIVEYNDAMVLMLNAADRSTMIGASLADICHPSSHAQEILQKLHEQGQLKHHQFELRRKNGGHLPSLANMVLLRADDGSEIIQANVVDISFLHDRRASAKDGVDDLTHAKPIARLVVIDGRVDQADPLVTELTGRDPKGLPVGDLFLEEDRNKIKSLIENGPHPKEDTLHVRANGHQELLVVAEELPQKGRKAIQLTVHASDPDNDLLKDRTRLRMVEEVNQVLRMEIAEHRRTQEQLRHSRRFARSLVDSSLDMIIAADPEGRITEYNPAASIRFGWEAQEVMGKSSLIFYADTSQHKKIQDELNANGVFAGEIQNITKYGEVFTSFLAASRLYDEDGQLLGAMGVSRDITQMLRDQEALRISEERYRDLFENATDLIQSIDAGGRFEYVNTAWRKALGHSDDELDKMNYSDIIHKDHRLAFQEVFERAMKEGVTDHISTLFTGKDGRVVIVEGTASIRYQDGKPVAMRSILRDVTNMHLAREKVQVHEAKLRALFESSEHMFWTVDPKKKLTSHNRGFGEMIERLQGTVSDQAIGETFANAGNDPFWSAKYEEALSGRALRFETDLIDHAGERVCSEIFLSPVFGPHGKVTEVFGVGHDITEQKVAEDLVREQAARLKAIFESSANMMIWTLDKDLRITSCNEHFTNTIETVHGIHFKVGDPFVEEMGKRVAGGRYKPLLARYQATLKGTAQQFEVELMDQQGRSVWVENFLNPIEADGVVREISCLAYGITDRKESQMELLRSLNEKEVLLKEVHHRVKNNLQVISSILSLQSAHVGDDKRILDLLRDSRDRIRSMSFIHESLYQTKDFSSIDLANYIEGLSRNLMMSYSLTGKIALETDLQKVHLVLDQAIPCGLILNELISNALKHAFPDSEEGVVRISLTANEKSVAIRISDSGVGVPAGFDVSKDGNLGLELVRTLVDQLDGHMEMTSGLGVSYLLTFEHTK